jgi:hypothetical protein
MTPDLEISRVKKLQACELTTLLQILDCHLVILSTGAELTSTTQAASLHESRMILTFEEKRKTSTPYL